MAHQGFQQYVQSSNAKSKTPPPRPKAEQAKANGTVEAVPVLPPPTASIPIETKGLPKLRLGQAVRVMVAGTVKGVMDGYRPGEPARLELGEVSATVEAKAPTMDEAGTMGWERIKRGTRAEAEPDET